MFHATQLLQTFSSRGYYYLSSDISSPKLRKSPREIDICRFITYIILSYWNKHCIRIVILIKNFLHEVNLHCISNNKFLKWTCLAYWNFWVASSLIQNFLESTNNYNKIIWILLKWLIFYIYIPHFPNHIIITKFIFFL